MNTDSILDAVMVMIMVLWFCGRTSLLGDAEIFRSELSIFAFKLFSKIKACKIYRERRRERKSKHGKMLTARESRGRYEGLDCALSSIFL